MSAFALTADALRGEVWRLWTGHLAHYSLQHFLLNVVAALPPLLLLEARDRWRALLWAGVAAPAVSGVILMTSFGSEYRGMSGLVVGLWFSAPILCRRPSWFACAMLIAATTKLIFEMTTSFSLGAIDVTPLPLAHWAGGAAGAVWAIAEMLLSRRHPPATWRQSSWPNAGRPGTMLLPQHLRR